MGCLVALTWGVAALHPEVVLFQLDLDVEIGQNQLVLDEAPQDPSHLVAVELDDRLSYLDFCHKSDPRMRPHDRAEPQGCGKIKSGLRRGKPRRDPVAPDTERAGASCSQAVRRR